MDEDKFHTDARDFMRMILNEPVGDFSVWRKQCLEAKTVLDNYDKQPGNYAVETIGALLPPNANVSVAVGMHQCWNAQSLVLKGYKDRIQSAAVMALWVVAFLLPLVRPLQKKMNLFSTSRVMAASR